MAKLNFPSDNETVFFFWKEIIKSWERTGCALTSKDIILDRQFSQLIALLCNR